MGRNVREGILTCLSVDVIEAITGNDTGAATEGYAIGSTEEKILALQLCLKPLLSE